MNNKINNQHPTKEEILLKQQLLKKRRILGYTKLALTGILIILFIFLVVFGIKNIFTKEDNKKQKQPNNQNTEIENNEETNNATSKYTKDEQEKLEKLDYINEKINYFKWDNIDRYLTYKKNNQDLSNEKIVLYVNIGIDNDFYTNIENSYNQNNNTILVNKYYRINNDFEPQNLKAIDSKYRTKYLEMTEEAATAFNNMAKDAENQGYSIIAISTYRTYEYQENLYNKYAQTDGTTKADTYSARPGHSEHHTALAVDIKNATKAYTKFGETKEFEWMKENAHKYGYILRYTKENEFITGYSNEPWHYRYVGIEIATQMKNENITSYEEYYFMYLDK